MVNVEALKQLILMRVRLFVREPEALFWTFGFPIILALALGLAFREDAEPPPVPIAVEAGAGADEVVGLLAQSRELAVEVMGVEEAARALRRGEVPLVVSANDSVTFRYDPSRPESREARLLADAALQSASGADRPVAIGEDPERQPGGRYIDWLIPGLIGLNLMSTGMWGIGFGVVTMRQKKQLKRLVATPMKKSDFLLATILARLLFLILEIPPIVLFAWLVFGVEISGSVLSFTVLVLLGAFTFAGLGLLGASRAKTIEGVSGINNLIMLPMFVLSGIFFSSSQFPDAMQPFIRALPLTALNDGMRAIYNEGMSITAAGSEILILLAWTVGGFLLALRLFRWQ